MPHRDEATLDAHRFLFPSLREGYTTMRLGGSASHPLVKVGFMVVSQMVGMC
jgi:hypothetical protein